jgi:hypothetical protein
VPELEFRAGTTLCRLLLLIVQQIGVEHRRHQGDERPPRLADLIVALDDAHAAQLVDGCNLVGLVDVIALSAGGNLVSTDHRCIEQEDRPVGMTLVVPPDWLFAVLAYQLACLWIDEMDRATCQAAYAFIDIAGPFGLVIVGRPALHAKAGSRASVQKG